MTIDELITYCEEKEHNHRLSCKRYDDASGYTRSKDKNIRTACAIREEKYADYYKEISATMRKYQKQEQVLDKIRSEIEQDAFKDVNGSKYIFVNRVNQILDKYKGEVRIRNGK